MPSPKTQFALPAISIAATLLLAACGGGGASGVSGSSSGGEFPVLAGTFTKSGASSDAGDSVFGAVNSAGNGFFADFGSNQAIYSFESASSSGNLNGLFAAYAAIGHTLGGSVSGLTLQNGNLSGTVSKQSSGAISATATFANTGSSGFSSTATINLDNPQAAPAALSATAGEYSASYSSGAAITSPGLSTNTSAVYAVALDAPSSSTSKTTAFAMTINGGCGSTGTATQDSEFNSTNPYNVLTLEVTVPANCIGNTSSLNLNGLAVYLKSGSASPLNGATLSTDTLLVELDDSLSASGSPTRALALVAARTAGP